MKQKGVLAFRILGVATMILGILNIASAIIYFMGGNVAMDLKLPIQLFYAYVVVSFLFGVIEFLAGFYANKAYTQGEYMGICFKIGIALIAVQVAAIAILSIGSGFSLQNVTGFVYPICYVVLVKICR